MNYAEIIQKLDADGAKRLLTQLAENHALVAELVEEYGPQCVAEGIPTWEDVANELACDLGQLDMDEVYHADLGGDDFQYPSETGYDLMEEMLMPRWDEIQRFHNQQETEETLGYLRGVVAGLYRFRHQDEYQSEFRECVEDEIESLAEKTFDKWFATKPEGRGIESVRDFIVQECPQFEPMFERLAKKKSYL